GIVSYSLTHYVYFFLSAENRKALRIKEQLLVLMTALHAILCFIEICDMARQIMNISLTRTECLRFSGVPFTAVSFGQSILYSLLGIEVIILISNASLFVLLSVSSLQVKSRYRKLKIWWFHAVVYSSFIYSAFCIYQSWISDVDYPILMCMPPTALIKEVNEIRNTVSCIFIFFHYILLTVTTTEQLLHSLAIRDHIDVAFEKRIVKILVSNQSKSQRSSLVHTYDDGNI
ncbi:hypothetical protein PENTCL1PPCAC_15699, partial [Pristionchus entomophagus]